VHNLRALAPGQPPAEWAEQFEAWLLATIEKGRFETLLDPQQWPKEFATAHPTLEHYAPLLVAWAAGGAEKQGRRLHNSFDYGNIGMSCYAFGE
jgi:4,5-DOPA dioxygenase extradiol